MLKTRKFWAICLGLPLSACANFTHYNSERPQVAGRSSVIFIDAKQRFLLSVPISKTTYTYADGKVQSQQTFTRAFCALGPPDAISAVAASGSGNISTKSQLAIGAAFGLSEGAAYVGLRTQSIELQREPMYRDCEAMVSGNLSSMQYETLRRRNQTMIGSLLAIEQLTGAVQGPSAAISGNAGVGNAELVSALTEKVIAARSTVDAKSTDAAAKATTAENSKKAADDYLVSKKVTKAEDLLAADKPAYDKLKEQADKDKGISDKATQDVATAKSNLADLEAAQTTARTGTLTTGTTALTSGGGQRSLDAAGIQSLSEAVRGIVQDTQSQGFFREVCATYFVGILDQRVTDGYEKGLGKACTDYAAKSTDLLDAQAQAVASRAAILSAIAANATDETVVKRLMEVLKLTPPSTPPQPLPAALPPTAPVR